MHLKGAIKYACDICTEQNYYKYSSVASIILMLFNVPDDIHRFMGMVRASCYPDIFT
jgi:hypothetical protein